MVGDQRIGTDPSDNHGTNPPYTAFAHHLDTFKTAQYLGREHIGVEVIQDHGAGKSGKMMGLDHFILWSRYVWTDPVSRRSVRPWKPSNGWQYYDPGAWVDEVADASVSGQPPPKCKKGGAKTRFNCDDVDGPWHP